MTRVSPSGARAASLFARDGKGGMVEERPTRAGSPDARMTDAAPAPSPAIPARDRHGNGVLAAFAGPSLPFAALGLPLIVHLPTFFARSLGLPLAAITAMFFVARILDIGADPFIGMWIDKTRTRIGRFKPWIIAGGLLLMVATWLCFLPVPGASLPYLAICLVGIYVAFSVVVLAQTSWAAVLSANYNERSRVYGWWQFGNVVGILLVLLLPVIVAARGGTEAQGVAAMGLFIVVLIPITVGLAVWLLPEPRVVGECHATLKDYFAFFKLASIRRLMLTDLLYGLAPGITGALALFYFTTVKAMDLGQANILIFAYFAAGLAGSPLWSWAALKLGKHRALALAGLVYAAAYVGVWAAPAGDFGMAVASMLLVGLPFPAGQILIRAMMADIGDEERLESGEDRSAMLFALMTLTNKLGTALSTVVLLPLAWVGFQQATGATNTASALNTLSGLFVILPILLLVASSLIIRRFPIDEARQKQVRAALEARDAGAGAASA
jgi:Na+/melibiose symporter-like transporter